MSTLVYGELQSNREDASPETSTSTNPPGMGYYVDTLAALVPSEVLVVHAAVLAITTETTKNANGESITTITNPDQLRWVFGAGIILSVILYLASHLRKGKNHWHLTDAGRMLIPPAAFILWTMAQKSTAFDATFPDVEEAARYTFALIGAVVLGILTAVLGNVADKTEVPSADTKTTTTEKSPPNGVAS